MEDKVAVVTGSNKGIGYSIVKELCTRGVDVVYLTSRNLTRRLESVERLKKEGLMPLSHILDVTDKDSVKAFADHIRIEHGGLDILINNAGVASNDFSTMPTHQDAVRVITTNYKSLHIIHEYLYPILRDNGRVINISSNVGHLSNIKNCYWVKRLSKKNINVDDVNAFVEWYLISVKNNTINESDFSEMSLLSYRVSKVAVSALTRAHQNMVGRGISINSLHPGFVKTDMTEHIGSMPLEQAGKTPAYLALELDQSVKGRYFWYDKTEKEWTEPKLIIMCCQVP